MIVVDASVFVKLLKQEEGSEAAPCFCLAVIEA